MYTHVHVYIYTYIYIYIHIYIYICTLACMSCSRLLPFLQVQFEIPQAKVGLVVGKGWAKGLRVSGLGFRVWGLGFRVWGLGFGV